MVKSRVRNALFELFNYKTLLRRGMTSSAKAIKIIKNRLTLRNSDFCKSVGVVNNWTLRGVGHD